MIDDGKSSTTPPELLLLRSISVLATSISSNSVFPNCKLYELNNGQFIIAVD